nr:uncharacterized protein LOC109025791 [Gorilla gorilla gorilla]
MALSRQPVSPVCLFQDTNKKAGKQKPFKCNNNLREDTSMLETTLNSSWKNCLIIMKPNKILLEDSRSKGRAEGLISCKGFLSPELWLKFPHRTEQLVTALPRHFCVCVFLLYLHIKKHFRPQECRIPRRQFTLEFEKMMEMMLDKKKIRVIFLFEVKMGHKAVETTRKINNTFGSGTANKCTVQWWFKKFCKGEESLENEEHSGWL